MHEDGSQGSAHDATDTDVLIVGAGMSGLYTAWRLLRHDPSRRIDIIEMLDRTGGRLDTDRVEINGVTVKTEEGGMRFMRSQKELFWLLGELGLSDRVVPFPMGDDHNVFYLRGHRFTAGQAKADPFMWSRLYDLNLAARGKQPGDILKDVLSAILRENGEDPKSWSPDPDDWTRFRMEFTYRGTPTYRWGFWSLLTDYGLSNDCIQMLYDSSGFIAPYDQQINAGCAFQLLVDFVDPDFHTLGPGYSLLPDTLAWQIQRDGASIHLEHTARDIDRLPDGRLVVTARMSDGENRRFRCRELVLGTTQEGLRGMIPYVPMFRDSERFLADVESVTDMALGKINLYYTEAWWRERLGITSGGSFTDLPLAQFYCFQTSRDAGSTGPASITVYTDYYRTNYWAELQELGEPFRSPMFPENPPHTTAASTYVVEAATRQMSEMFGIGNVPDPVLATYRRWMDRESGDGDHQWRIGVKDPEVRRRLSNPFPNVYVCGETWSDDQTWVNGALRSTNEMLETRMGLPTPALESAGATGWPPPRLTPADSPAG